jgi:hypothetical protein
MTETENVPPGFDEFCIVELMGHRRVAARVTEAAFPAGFLRLDEPGGRTQIVAPASVYAIHPTTEEIVARMAKAWASVPVSRYELAMAKAEEPADEEFDADSEEGPF